MLKEFTNDSGTSITNAVQDIVSSLSSKDNTVQFYSKPIDGEKLVMLNDNELLDMLNMTFSKIPQIAAAAINISSSEQIKNIVEGGVFKIVFKNGVNDKTIADLCKNSEGLLITSYRDSNGFNQAGLSSVGDNINKHLNFSNTANIINGTMAVLSVVVGSYYMHNINNNLKDINSKLEKLLGIVNDMNLSKLKSIHQSLLTIIRDLNCLNDMQIQSYCNSVVQHCDDTLTISKFYETQLNNAVKNFVNFDKSSLEKSFIKNLNDYQNNLNYYQLSLKLHIISLTVEIIISNNQSDEFINNHVSDIHKYCEECKEKWCAWNYEVTSWIEKTKAFDPKLWEKIRSYSDGIGLGMGTGMLMSINPLIGIGYLLFGNSVRKKNDERMYSSSRKKRDLRLQEHMENDIFEKFEINTAMIDNYVKRINRIKNNEVCLVYRNEKLYIEENYLNDLEMEET